jgi:hypothetical protein
MSYEFEGLKLAQKANKSNQTAVFHMVLYRPCGYDFDRKFHRLGVRRRYMVPQLDLSNTN